MVRPTGGSDGWDAIDAIDAMLDRAWHGAEIGSEMARLGAEERPLAERLLQNAAALGASIRLGPLAAVPTIEGYEVLALLGSGGMGNVFRARQLRPVERLVAIKVIKKEIASKEAVARFELERRALAAMSHSSVCRVFEAGTTDGGEPYVAMELVDGLSLTQYCDENYLSLEQRLELFGQVCLGVHHAHQKGLAHRDLKPSNIVVASEDGRAVPKVLDFGLVKAIHGELVPSQQLTEGHVQLGTRDYVSPEQAAGQAGVDTRTDVYSLGVVLFELLTSALPFSSSKRGPADWVEVAWRLRHEDPPPLSLRVGQLGPAAEEAAARRGVTLRGLMRALRGDLLHVVRKAMDRKIDARYDSAAALAADIHRVLAREPIDARRPSWSYWMRRLVQRRRGAATAVALVSLAIVAGGISTTVQMLRAEHYLEMFQQLELKRALSEAHAQRDQAFPAVPSRIAALQAFAGRIGTFIELGQDLEKQLADLRDGEQPVLRAELRHLTVEIERVLTGDGGLSHVVGQQLRWAIRLDAYERGAEFQRRWNSIAKQPAAVVPGPLVPQTGLVPIGINPVTKLAEFYDLRSAVDLSSDPDPAAIPIPAHRQDGRLDLEAAPGIVYVLVPGSAFMQGAQRGDKTAPNYDPDAQPHEAPGSVVEIEAFLIGKHEVTQGQWLRLMGRNPSAFPAGNEYAERVVTALHPVEQVSWPQAKELGRRLCASLPTEAQWEYACRAGTSHVFFAGDRFDSLAGFANLGGQEARGFLLNARLEPGWRDGFVVHAPVGSQRPNPFGLYDMVGNVAEWCLDRYDWRAFRELTPRPGDGLRQARGETKEQIIRGGSYASGAAAARSAWRARLSPGHQSGEAGFRLARTLQRDE
ncbi:MAG: bifunctional serine/threonine-protein kinase/formylglycine-generating enzyme family protein [Planctomycetota bacterium]